MKREMTAAAVAAVVGFGVGVWVGRSWDGEAWFLIQPSYSKTATTERVDMHKPLWQWVQVSIHGNRGDCELARRKLATQLEGPPGEWNLSKATAALVRCVPTQVLAGARGR